MQTFDKVIDMAKHELLEPEYAESVEENERLRLWLSVIGVVQSLQNFADALEQEMTEEGF